MTPGSRSCFLWRPAISMLVSVALHLTLVLLLASAIALAPVAGPLPFEAEAQQIVTKPNVGYLGGSASALFHDAFRQRLAELGYHDGTNIIVVYRWHEGRPDKARELAQELVRLNVDVLVAIAPPAVMAAKTATQTIPIVFAAMTDPVQLGVVKSLSRPGGNLTGVSFEVTPELNAKLIEFLVAAAPHIRRVAILWNAANQGSNRYFDHVRDAARGRSLDVIELAIERAEDLDRAWKTADREHPDGIVVLPDPVTVIHRQRIVDGVAIRKIPAVYSARQMIESGGLLSYGPSLADQVRLAADYVARILRGAKVADLPVQQPTKFELVINLKTAKALGVTIPPALLLRADQVIE